MHTPHAAADIQAAVKKTLTSAAFTKFMAAAVQTAIEAVKAKPDEAVLAAQPTHLVKFSERGNFSLYECRSADGTCEVHMQTSRFDENPSHRNKWYGCETRTDQQGRIWSRSIGYMVADDFGVLVPVAA